VAQKITPPAEIVLAAITGMIVGQKDVSLGLLTGRKWLLTDRAEGHGYLDYATCSPEAINRTMSTQHSVTLYVSNNDAQSTLQPRLIVHPTYHALYVIL